MPETQAELTRLVSFEVLAPKKHGALLRAYAEATDLKFTEEGDKVRAGPFVSQFEAGLVAGWVPGGSFRLDVQFPEGATPEPWVQRSAGSAPRVPSQVATQRALGERFAMVTFDADEGLKEQELHQISATGPRFLIKLPPRPSLEVSAGMLASRAGDELTFFQVMNQRKDDTIKAERVVMWRWGDDSRSVLSDLPFLELRLPEKGEPELLVTRIRVEGSRARLVRYKVAFKRLPGAADVALAVNDWTSERWKDKDLVDLVAFVGVQAAGEQEASLE